MRLSKVIPLCPAYKSVTGISAIKWLLMYAILVNYYVIQGGCPLFRMSV